MSGFHRSLIAALLVLVPLPVGAEFATREEARAVAGRWLEHRQAGGEEWGAATLNPAVELRRDGRLLGTLFSVKPQGHIVVSAIKELPPIKSFSATSDFDPSAKGYPEMVQDAIQATLVHLEETHGELERLPSHATSNRHRDAWHRLLAGEAIVRDADAVGPLLQSDWHQQEPYWDDCPPGDGGLCVVGCLATAIAQVMNYWRYPEHGQGSFSYSWPGDDSCGGDTEGQQLTAVYDDAYRWDEILQSYAGDYTPTQAAAVAELCYEVGVAFTMDYGHCGSGASPMPAETVLAEHFLYAEGVEFIERASYDADTWWSLVRNELDAFPARVIFYGILSHAIVCDGYTEDGGRFYHMNYGWGGYYDGWFAIDEVTCPWGCDYLQEGMCVGIEPAGFFPVTEPASGAVWTHGESCGPIAWAGSSADSVVVDLFRGKAFVARIVDWTANDGYEIPAVAVDPAWGTGAQFRLKVVGADERFGWTGQFGIYGPDAWTDIAPAPLAAPASGRGAAWADLEGDGLPDLYLVNSQGGNRLLGNQGGGVFVDLSAPPIDDGGYGAGAVWGDHDNDGDPDLYLAKTAGQANRLLRNDGGVFVDVTAGALGEPAYAADAAWADYDGDGRLDLFVAGTYQPDRLFRGEGGDLFVDVSAPPVNDGGCARGASWCDVDDDGDPDLYLVRSNVNRLYRNEGDGLFLERAAAHGLADGGDGRGAAWGDQDNDGDMDLLLVNQDGCVLYLNEGGQFAAASSPLLATARAWRCAAWGDADNDGWLDLYLVAEGENLFCRNVAGLFADATSLLLGDPAAGQSATWADIDADGDLDLALVNDGAPGRLLRNDQSSGNHWLQVDLAGTASNRSAIGARLRLVAGGMVQSRQIGGDAGAHAGSALTAHFGLGTATLVDTLEIRWPSGIVQRSLALAVDTRHAIEESATAVGGNTAGPFALRGNHPNPFNPSTTIRFELPRTARITLSVHDLSGRRVRTLASGERPHPAGPGAVDWNGRDDHGRPLPSGLYFCRLSDGVSIASCKVTLIK